MLGTPQQRVRPAACCLAMRLTGMLPLFWRGIGLRGHAAARRRAGASTRAACVSLSMRGCVWGVPVQAVRAIGRCAVTLERAAERCINVLLELIKQKVNYVVQESIVVIKDIFRRYPNRCAVSWSPRSALSP